MFPGFSGGANPIVSALIFERSSIMSVNRFVLNGISYHGHGAIQEIPGIVKSKGLKKAFVASDPDLVKFGVTKKVTDLLEQNGIAFELYSDIKPNPTIENVQHGVDAYRASGADFMITIGGGSSMDTGKGIGIIVNNPEYYDVRSLEGVAPTKNRTVFTIAVPTTGGTGAESTINYVITDVEKRRKFVCVDPNDIPDVAVVDPDMMSSMPKGLTASTGMDALTHAIEGYTTAAAWELADVLNLEAIQLIAKNLRKAVQNDPDGREGMALAQYVTAMAYSNVGLGIAHSMAHTLGAVYDTPHVMKIAEAFGVCTDGMSQAEYRKAAIDAVKQLSVDVGIPTKLAALKEEDLPFLCQSAAADACAPGNPRHATLEDFEAMFRKLM